MKKFVIKVDLCGFFDDERKMSMILVEPEWTSVKCLQQKLRTLFNLKSLHFMTKDGCYIPLEESIEVLQFVDYVKAFITKLDKVKSKKKKTEVDTDNIIPNSKRSRNNEECVEEAQNDNLKNKHVFFEEKQNLFKFICLLENESSTKARIFDVINNQ